MVVVPFSNRAGRRPRTRVPTLWYVGGDDVRLRIPLLRRLRRRGFRVGVVGSEEGDPFEQHNIPYWRYPLRRGLNPTSDLQALRHLKRLLSHHRPDVVHAFNTKPSLITPLAARQAGISACVRTITGMGFAFSSNSPVAMALRPAYRMIQKRTSSATQVTIFQNPDDREYFRTHALVPVGSDALVLGSGIDVSEFMAQCCDQPALDELRQSLGLRDKVVVTMVARLIKSKGVLDYLRAAAIVCRQRTDVAFLLIGPEAGGGPQTVSISAVNRASGVRYLGRRDDIAAMLGISDVFVLPSYYREGIPRVLLEAGASGLPLITTDLPGCKEVVRDGWNGRLVPPKNGQALAEALQSLLVSSAQRRMMGARSNSWVRENFSLDRVASAYEDIYVRAMGSSDERVEFRRSA